MQNGREEQRNFMEINKMQKLCKTQFAAGYEKREWDGMEWMGTRRFCLFFDSSLSLDRRREVGGVSCLYFCCVQRPLTIHRAAAALDCTASATGYRFIWGSARAQCAPSVCIILVGREGSRMGKGRELSKNKADIVCAICSAT